MWMGNEGVMYDGLVRAHRACPWEDEATRVRTAASCGFTSDFGPACEAELKKLTDAMLGDMKTGLMVSGSVRGVACGWALTLVSELCTFIKGGLVEGM